MRFVFKGTHGSLGYVYGSVYELLHTAKPESGCEVAIVCEDGHGYCPYQTWEDFFANWEMIDG
jgi:hypothetical protein